MPPARITTTKPAPQKETEEASTQATPQLPNPPPTQHDGIGGLSGKSWTKGTTATDRSRELEIFPNYADDPEPLDPTAPKKEHINHLKTLRDYSSEMFTAFSKTSMRGEHLWTDFISSFRPHTIRSWTKPMLHEWRDLLIRRGIYVQTVRTRSPYEAIIDVLYWPHYANPKDMMDEGKNQHEEDANDAIEPDSAKKGQPQEEDKRAGAEAISERNYEAGLLQKLDQENKSSNHPTRGYTGHKGEPSEGSDSSDDSDNELKKKNTNHVNRRSEGVHETGSDEDPHYEKRGLGLSGMVRAFTGQTKFTGRYEEDLDGILETFETYATMCDLTDSEKRKSIPIMLSGNALSLFNKEAKACETFDEAATLLGSWYNSSEKQTRLLRDWQGMRLTSDMEKDPSASEITVYRTFVAKLMSTQQQLEAVYHGDRHLRDQLIASIDIPKVQDTLKDRVPRTAHQLVNRVANRLSDKPRSAGITSAYLSSHNQSSYPSSEDERVNYTLGQNYGGAAKRETKGFVRRPFRNRNDRQGDGPRRKRQLPKWLKGVKGCMVCGKEDHIANQRHSPDEVTKAVRRLKEKSVRVMLTEEDLAFVSEMFATDNDGGGAASEDESGEGDNQDSDLLYMAEDDLGEIQAYMADVAFLHGRTIQSSRGTMISEMYHAMEPKGQTNFDGVKIDTAANRKSIMGTHQYDEYCKTFGLRPAIRTQTRGVIGIGGRKSSIGTVTIQIPFPNLGLIIDVCFLLMTGNVPTLLCMKDMIDNNLDISLQHRTITHEGRKQQLRLENYFLVYRWGFKDMTYTLFTEQELLKIHKVFGHPSVGATQRMLRRAKGEALDKKTRGAIAKITEDCKICKTHAAKPRRFKLTIGADGLKFNCRVQVDTMFIRGRPVIHMVDMATHFSAAAFLRNQSSSEVWKAIQGLWNLVYMGPPDFLMVDQGTNYTSQELRGNLDAHGITLQEAPIETPGAIGTVERYHAPLRAAYERIRAEVKTGMTDDECLKMAVFAVNSTVGPEGLCPILLVFGAIPRPARTSPTITQLERARAIDAAMKEAEHEQSKRRIAFGLKHSGGQKGKESSAILHELPAGSPVLLYREVTKSWEGPFQFVSVSGETAVIQTPRGRRIFRTSCVRPWTKPKWTSDTSHTQHESQTHRTEPNQITSNTYAIQPHGNGPSIEEEQKPGKSTKKESERSIEFIKSRKQELKGLLMNGTFLPMDRAEIPHNTRVFGSRFVDELKRAERGLRRKSRLVAQNYSDEGATQIPTKAPTIQRATQRLVMSLAASIEDMTPFIRDVTQAYVQSRSKLERDVYIKAPTELDLPPDTVLKVVKPLYGIPESGLHWYLTYVGHHIDKLNMTRATSDPCLLIRRDGTNLQGIVILQVDDSFAIGTEEFEQEEDEQSKEFLSKPKTILTEKQIPFNGIMIAKEKDGTIKVTQQEKITKLQHPATQKDFTSQRALAQYIGVCTRPDVCANIQLIAPGAQKTTEDEFRTLKKTMDHLSATKERGLTYKRIDMSTMRLIVISDASFANTRNLRSQLGFIILMADETGTANIIHYGSSQCKRVTRSILAAEIHALVLAYDHAYVIRHTLIEILGRNVKLEAYVDSRSVFDVIAKDGNTTEKRLQIDIYALRQSYADGELDQIGWIPGTSNPADALTKINSCTTSPLQHLMTSNKLHIDPIGWASISTEKNSRTASQPTCE